MTLYRSAGHSVLSVLERGADVCERASIDEVYLDITTAASRRLAEWGGPGTGPPPLPSDIGT